MASARMVYWLWDCFSFGWGAASPWTYVRTHISVDPSCRSPTHFGPSVCMVTLVFYVGLYVRPTNVDQSSCMVAFTNGSCTAFILIFMIVL